MALAVARSSGRYIGGEATAIVSSLEGGFPFPRRKPPHPTESGIGGAPTLINNTETIANVPHILREGPAAYRALGVGEACGTKLYSLSGDVLRPGLYELPMGTSCASSCSRMAAGCWAARRSRACSPVVRPTRC